MIVTPLVWVPYPVQELGIAPEALQRAEVRHVDLGALATEDLARIEEVRFAAVPTASTSTSSTCSSG